MKRKLLFMITILIFVFTFSLLTACNDDTTLDNLINDYGAVVEGGSFPEGAILVTTPVDETSDQGKSALSAIKGYDYNVFKPAYIFDISVVKDNAEVQPNGKVKVTIPVSTDLVSYRIVLHIKDSGIVEKLSASYSDGKISFETDSFSIFVLVEPSMINHLHTFRDEWSKDEINHWHDATCEHFAEKSDLGEHSWDNGEITTPATEEKDGVKTYTCTVCGYEKTESVKYHEHNFSGEWSQSETHHWHDCMTEDCDAKSEYEEHYYDSHAWWEVIKPATETEEGDMIRICIGCKYEDHHVIPKLDPDHEHTYEEEWSSNAGYHWHYATCAHLNEYGDEAEHSWDEGVITKPATDEDGIMTYTCTVCGWTRKEPIAHVHTFSEDWSKDENYHWHAATCSHTNEVEGKTEHKWNDGVITTPATAENDGVKTYTCIICDATKTESVEYVAHDHNFSSYWTRDDDYHWHACTSGDNCTEVDGKEEHTWGEPNVKREPTDLRGGLIEYTCTVCGRIKKVTSPHEHIYGDWQFTPTHHWQLTNCGNWSDHNGISGPQSEHEYVDGVCKDCGIKDPSVASIGLEFTLQEDDTYYVSGIGTCTDVHIVIPSVYEGKAVTGVADDAFQGKNALRSVYLPDSVKIVGNNAFKNCYNLNSVRFPDDMTSIGEYAFDDCNLYTLTLPTKTISEIKAGAFSQNSAYLLSIYIPDNITKIGNHAFEGCRLVEELRLPETMESLGESCFANLRALPSVTIPKGLTELPGYVFYYCYELTEITIPNWIETIGKCAFDGCKNLTTVHFSEGLTSIGMCAFRNTKLKSVTIPSTLTELTEEGIFMGCQELEEVILHDDFITIGLNTFRGCTKLAQITLPAGLTTLGQAAFDNSGIELIVIPEKITVISHSAFWGCENLTSVTLPEGLLKIDYGAFYNCTALKEISIPDGVTEIVGDAFALCKELTTINIPTSLTVISSGVFQSTKIKNIVIPDSVITIASYAFSNNTELENVTFGKNVEIIEHGVFEYCSGLKQVNLPNSVKSIGNNAFYGCDSLTRINLPESVEVIGERVFAECENLTTVTIPSGIKMVGRHNFLNSDNVKFNEYDNAYYLGNDENPYLVLIQVKDKSATSCIINSNTVIIAGYAFDGSAVMSITIPDSVKFIEGKAFTLLESLDIPSVDDWCEIKSETEKTYEVLSESAHYSWNPESKYATPESRASKLVYSTAYGIFRKGFLPDYTKVED